MSSHHYANARGVSLIEVVMAMTILVVVTLGAAGYRYCSALDARKAEVQITAARIGSALLNGWKGVGGHSGYSNYEVENPDDYNPNDPNDYNPNVKYDIELGLGLETNYDAPGPAVPEGFSGLDATGNPNYHFVVGGVNYYATLSYKDQTDGPRVLNVSVAWMDTHQTWDDSGPYRSVDLTTYACD